MNKCANKEDLQPQILLHFIYRDKFTVGYIYSMEELFPEYNHFFALVKDETDFVFEELNCRNNILIYCDKDDFLANKKLNQLIKQSEKIIVSGIFDICAIDELLYYPQKVWNKIYLHFWGGDFYKWDNKQTKANVSRKTIIKFCILKCAGVINLIESDYEKLIEIFNIKNGRDINHFVGMMPNIGLENDRETVGTEKKGRVLLGNSASIRGCHMEALEELSKYKGHNIEIICPLSYGGNKEYVDNVIRRGKEIFGKKFVPVQEYMAREDYLKLLSSCEVAVFNNDRQQAMGNINVMLKFRKKVYIRKDSSMWMHYDSLGLKLYNISSIQDETWEEFLHQDKEIGSNNRLMLLKYIDRGNQEDQWRKIFLSTKKTNGRTFFINLLIRLRYNYLFLYCRYFVRHRV